MNYFDFMFESECGVQKDLAELNRKRSKKFFRMFCGNIDIALNKAIQIIEITKYNTQRNNNG